MAIVNARYVRPHCAAFLRQKVGVGAQRSQQSKMTTGGCERTVFTTPKIVNAGGCTIFTTTKDDHRDLTTRSAVVLVTTAFFRCL